MSLELPSYEETLCMLKKETELPHQTSTISQNETTSTKCEGEICKIAKKTIRKEKSKKNDDGVKSKIGGVKKVCESVNGGCGKVKVINISYPYEYPPHSKTNKRFYVFVEFTKGSDPTNVLRKKISFGEKGVAELIDGAESQNPLHPHFYRTRLLSSSDDIKDSYVKLIKNYL